MIKMYELDELEELIAYLETTSLEPHDDYTSEFTYKDQKLLYKYITKLVNDKTKLQNNWNELKKYLLEDDWSSVNGEIASKLILKKMQELQGEGNNDSKRDV